MSTTIAAVAGTTVSGLGTSRHVIYGTNSGYYWAFAFTGTSVLSTYYSTDNTSWSAGATHTLTNAHNSEGRNLAVSCKAIGSYDVVHIAIAFKVGTTQIGMHTIRATIVGTTFTFHSSETTFNSGTTDPDNLFWAAPTVEFDTSNRVHVGGPWASASSSYNGAMDEQGSGVDPGTAEQMTPLSWTDNQIDASQLTERRSGCLLDLGSGTMGFVADNGSATATTTGLEWATWPGSGAWSQGSGLGNVDVTGTISAIDHNDWGVIARVYTDVHVVYRNAAGALKHRRWDGTSWSNGQTIPAQTSLAGGGIALTTDGRSIWLSVIDTDAPNTIRTIRWVSDAFTGTGDAWDAAWTATESSSQTRTFIGSPRDVVNTIGLAYWTEGSNLVAATFVAVTPDPVWFQTAQVSSSVSQSSLGVAFASNLTAGNRIIVGISIFGNSGAVISSITDSAGNTYAKDSPACVLSDGSDVSVWSAPIVFGAGTKPTVTAHASLASFKWALYINEYNVSQATSAYLDGTKVNNVAAITSPATSGASTPAPGATGELAFGLFGDTNAQTTISASSGWTLRGTAIADPTGTTAEAAIADQATTAGTGSNASFVITNTGAAAGVIVVVYKLAPGGIAIGPFEPSLNPLTMPGGPYSQMLWVASEYMPVSPAGPVTVGMILQAQRRRIYMQASQRRVRVFTALADIAIPQPPARRFSRAVSRRRAATFPLAPATPAAPAFIPGPARPVSRARANARRLVRLQPFGADGALPTPPRPTARRPPARRGTRIVGLAGDALLLPQPPRSRVKIAAAIRSRVANVIPWYQANPNTNQPLYAAMQARRRPWLAWLRRARSNAPPLAVDAPPPPLRPRARPGWLRRSRTLQLPLVVDLAPAGARLRRAVAWLRRVRPNAQPMPQAAAAPNPAFIDVHRRLIQRWWTRAPHGRTQEPPWGQATAAVNPAFTDWIARRLRWGQKPRRAAQQPMPFDSPPAVAPTFRRLGWWKRPARPAQQTMPWALPPAVAPAFTDWIARRLRWWGRPARAAQQTMPWTQPTVAPPSTVIPPARARRPWSLLRFRRAAALPDVPQGTTTSPRRRTPWPLRTRRQVLLTAIPAADAPPLRPRARRLLHRPRRPLAALFPWPQGINLTPIQPIALAIYTRSMAVVAWTRQAAAITVVTRSMAAVAWTRDMAIKIITRSENTRTNTRG